MKNETKKINLPCDLTNEELLQKAQELARSKQRIDELEEELSDFKARNKSGMEEAAGRIKTLTRQISTKKEYRNVDCYAVVDKAARTKSWFREDTGEFVSSEEATLLDIQNA